MKTINRKSVKLSQVEAFLVGRTGTQTWQVSSVTKFPAFWGEVTEEEIAHRHGGYTTLELMWPGYFFDGWQEAGYRITEVREEEDDAGPIFVEMQNGPIKVTVTLQQYA